jgi:hypothetical protein
LKPGEILRASGLLELATTVSRAEIVTALRAPGNKIIGLLQARAEQLADPMYQVKSWERGFEESGW